MKFIFTVFLIMSSVNVCASEQLMVDKQCFTCHTIEVSSKQNYESIREMSYRFYSAEEVVNSMKVLREADVKVGSGPRTARRFLTMSDADMRRVGEWIMSIKYSAPR